MKASSIPMVAALILVTALSLNQWRMHRARTSHAGPSSKAETERAEHRPHPLEAQLHEAGSQLEIAQQKLANAQAQIAQLDQRLRQLESGPTRMPRAASFTGDTGLTAVPAGEAPANNVPKRSWGPEQAAGEPDTFQAGDISTAWAPLEQDGGEEWLRLDYERVVDIAEVRVRETHNPGAIARVTAFLADGSEVILWEGTEPPAAAPVEMSFQIPSSVNAQSVKIYLDTKRTPGWNEIDAVELIGRDGSHQWAKKATASSTYAKTRGAGQSLGLERF